jgi:hypothetical protein
MVFSEKADMPFFRRAVGEIFCSFLLMRVREAPTEREIETRACSATETLMARRKRCTNLS